MSDEAGGFGAGARFVACVEHSQKSIAAAVEVLHSEVRPRLAPSAAATCSDEEMSVYLQVLDRHGARQPLRELQTASATVAERNRCFGLAKCAKCFA